MFARRGLPFKRLNALAGRHLDECADADRQSPSTGPRISGFSRARALRRRSQARGHAARGGAAQPRGAWPHRARSTWRRRAPCRACMRSSRRRISAAGAGHSAAARQPAGVQELPAAGDRPATRCAMSASRWRWWWRRRRGRPRTRWRRSRSISSGCRRCRIAMRRRATNRCCSTASATARCATRRSSATPTRRSPRPNTPARKNSAATG